MRVDAAGRDVLTGPLRSALDRLQSSTQAPLTARSEWWRPWFACTPQWEPWVLGVQEGGELLGAVVLARRRLGPLVQVVAAGHGAADEVRLAAAPGSEQALAAAVAAGLRRLGRPWALRLEQLPAGEATTQALTASLPRALLLPGDGLPRVSIPAGTAAPSSRNSRSAEARARKRLLAAGELEQRWLTDPQEVLAALPDVERVHRERDLDARGASQHDRPEVRRFYRQVVREQAEAGRVDLLVLRVDGDLAAYVLGFRDGPVLRVWDNRVSPRWREASAGRLANGLALQHVAEDAELDELDWMRGEESYKLSSATRVDPCEHLLAWSSAAAELPWRAKQVARRALRRADL